MGTTTKIDWCDATWNPVTGCYHGCEYCYARRIACRFGGKIITGHDHLYILDKPIRRENGTISSYPYGFDPTFHRYKLDEPQQWKKPRTIFVCSMADLFGDWVPDEWINAVLETCIKLPRHRFMFLTKNPERYVDLARRGYMPKRKYMPHLWLGSTVTRATDKAFKTGITYNTFLSIEPLLEPLNAGIGSFGGARWIIIGAETGNRKGKVVPEKAWVDNICEAAKLTGAAVFMKESLRELMGDDFRQEFPWKDDLD